MGPHLNPLRRPLFALALACAAAVSGHAASEEVLRHADGSLHVRYALDGSGQRSGAYTAYHPSGSATRNGAVAEKGTYRAGKLDGLLVRQDAKGTVVAEEQWAAGRLLAPFSERIIAEKLAAITAAADASAAAFAPLPGKKAPATQELASTLARINGIRFLCGLPHDVGLDPQYVHYAQSGADLLAKLGRLDHTPKNPGLPQVEFDDGFAGTSKGNLAMGGSGSSAVDMYLFDSDTSNRDRVGHRRWVLWPDLQRTGTGSNGKFSSLFVMGAGRKPSVPIADFAYPPRGLVPLSWYRTGSAWSWHPDPKVFPLPKGGGAALTVYPYDLASRTRAAAPLTTTYANVDTQGFGGRPAVIAIPELAAKKGAAFEVVITGVTPKAASASAAAISWVTIFY